jgi:signal transduction histidine kinase
MHADTEPDANRLRAVLRDLVALSAIPAAWIGREPSTVATGLADALVELLQLDFVFVRLRDPDGAGAVDATRGSAWPRFPDWLETHLGTGAQFRHKEIVPDMGGGSEPCRGLVVPVGFNGDGGVVAAACTRSDFPTATDELLLSLAANHAATAFQSARLIDERRRAEEALRRARGELEVKVAERTAELGQLADEQAALRRLATLVAQGVRPTEIFSAVSEEVGRLFGIGTAGVVRFEQDGPAIVFVGVSKNVEGVIPIGTRWQLDDALTSAEVYRTGRSARVDDKDWSSVSGPVGAARRRLGLVSTVASPIIVEGRHWGAATVSAKVPLPADADKRLEKFTELLATAIANADSQAELAASRLRIVAASDEARRRIELDLHDGLQQRLVSLGLAVRAAETQVPQESGDLRAELSRIATGLADAMEDLREISHGIHPSILSEGGLGPALRALARRSTIAVELDVATEARFPGPIEIAAYFVASEALANATKHAQASRIELALATRNDSMLLLIRDDGIGGADPAHGSGLVGLTDRVEALGGSIEVRSSAGQGTQITAELPVQLDLATGAD